MLRIFVNVWCNVLSYLFKVHLLNFTIIPVDIKEDEGNHSEEFTTAIDTLIATLHAVLIRSKDMSPLNPVYYSVISSRFKDLNTIQNNLSIILKGFDNLANGKFDTDITSFVPINNSQDATYRLNHFLSAGNISNDLSLYDITLEITTIVESLKILEQKLVDSPLDDPDYFDWLSYYRRLGLATLNEVAKTFLQLTDGNRNV